MAASTFPATDIDLPRSLPGWLGAAALLLAGAGLALGAGLAQSGRLLPGEFGIAFVHVPAAWASLALYVAAAACAALTLTLDARLPALALAAVAPTGAVFSVVALWTGATWSHGSGQWGAWDARLVCTLLLLLLFVGVIALRRAVHDLMRADRGAAVLVLVGALNVPMIYYSLRWWDTLHAAPAAAADASGLAGLAMVLVTLGFCLAGAAVAVARLQVFVREQAAVPRTSHEPVRTEGLSGLAAAAKEQQ